MTLLVPNVPVDEKDVVEACRILLRRIQDHHYVAWRENRWYSDDDLAKQVKQAHWDQLYNQRSYLHPDSVLSLVVAQEILLAGLSETPLRVISSLDQLGVHHKDTSDEVVRDALRLTDLPWLFDSVRISQFPLHEVLPACKVLGHERFQLMFVAGMSPEEILADVYAGVLAELDTLRVLAALLVRDAAPLT